MKANQPGPGMERLHAKGKEFKIFRLMQLTFSLRRKICRYLNKNFHSSTVTNLLSHKAGCFLFLGMGIKISNLDHFRFHINLYLKR